MKPTVLLYLCKAVNVFHILDSKQCNKCRSNSEHLVVQVVKKKIYKNAKYNKSNSSHYPVDLGELIFHKNSIAVFMPWVINMILSELLLLLLLFCTFLEIQSEQRGAEGGERES